MKGTERGHGTRPPARWLLWWLPARVKVAVLLVDVLAVAAVVLVGTAQAAGAWSYADWAWPVLTLVAAGILCTEASLGVERMRRRTDQSPHIDLSSVWTFAGAALLPGAPAAVVALIVYLHIYLRVWRVSGVPAHRVVYSTATIVLAVLAASAVAGIGGRGDQFRSAAGLGLVAAAMLAYAAVNITLVVGMLVLSAPSRDRATLRQMLGSLDDVVLEFATLSMGGLVAAAMASFGSAYAVLGLPPLIVLHRTVLVRQLEEAASTDGKTGLLNASAWHVHAGREMERAGRADRPSTVLVLDLDHFKRVNDEHGHLVGDHVLAAVARAVRGEVRDGDIVGRFGGEEFVVLLRAVDGPVAETVEESRFAARAVAERIRQRIADLRVPVPGSGRSLLVGGLTVSIGGATRPFDGHDLGRLLEVADAAMYGAKRGGRNQVRMGLPAEEAPRTG